MDQAKASAIKRQHSAKLLARPGVCGVGVEKDEQGRFVIAVHIDAAQEDVAGEIPTTLEGCPVKVVRSGPFKKQ
jgi:hypothetical protein